VKLVRESKSTEPLTPKGSPGFGNPEICFVIKVKINILMRSQLLILFLTLLSISAAAAEIITIVSPYGPSHGGTAADYRLIERANSLQQKYRFVLEFKPGAQQLLALKEIDQHPQQKLAIVAPSIVENTRNNTVDVNDYIPVSAIGDACWVVVSNLGQQQQGINSFKQVQITRNEITAGGVAFGNAAHLTALEIAQKYNLGVRYVVFKSNTEALIQGMISSNDVNLVIVPFRDFESLRTHRPQLTALAVSCPTRLPQLPTVKTLREQGITVPYIFNATVAHRLMESSRREEIASILQEALQSLGAPTIQQLSDMSPPTLRGLNLKTWFDNSYYIIDQLLEKHTVSIGKNRQGITATP